MNTLSPERTRPIPGPHIFHDPCSRPCVQPYGGKQDENVEIQLHSPPEVVGVWNEPHVLRRWSNEVIGGHQLSIIHHLMLIACASKIVVREYFVFRKCWDSRRPPAEARSRPDHVWSIENSHVRKGAEFWHNHNESAKWGQHSTGEPKGTDLTSL